MKGGTNGNRKTGNSETSSEESGQGSGQEDGEKEVTEVTGPGHLCPGPPLEEGNHGLSRKHFHLHRHRNPFHNRLRSYLPPRAHDRQGMGSRAAEASLADCKEGLMTALLTDSELQTTRELARMNKHTLAGHLAGGEAFYFDGGRFSIEKDHLYLVEPTEDELAEIHRLVRPEPEDTAPARGIVIGMLIALALCLALGIVIYRTFF
jgi:hypothetical protein